MRNVKKRFCLRCGSSFRSKSAGRRICVKCTRINEKTYTPNTIALTNDKTLNGKTIPSTRK